MRWFLLRRLLGAILLIWLVVTATFLLVEGLPGSAAEVYCQGQIESASRRVSEATCQGFVERFALDQPFPVRYLTLMSNLLRGDFGVSLRDQAPVFTRIAEQLPTTLALNLSSLLLCLGMGIALGVLQARHVGRGVDRVTGLGSIVLQATPEFLLGMVLIHVFVVRLDLFSLGARDHVSVAVGGEALMERLRHLVLPVMCLSLANTARLARLFRSRLLEILGEEFIVACRARGLSEFRILTRHAARNAISPVITLVGLSLPWLFSGSVVMETLFGLPGVGHLMFEAIGAQDTPLLVASFLVLAVFVILGNLLADIGCAIVDPRVRASGQRGRS